MFQSILEIIELISMTFLGMRTIENKLKKSN